MGPSLVAVGQLVASGKDAAGDEDQPGVLDRLAAVGPAVGPGGRDDRVQVLVDEGFRMPQQVGQHRDNWAAGQPADR